MLNQLNYRSRRLKNALVTSLGCTLILSASGVMSRAQIATNNTHVHTNIDEQAITPPKNRAQTKQLARQHRLRIPSQTLQHAIIDFVEQTNIGVVIAQSVDQSLRLPAVHGIMSAEAALSKLLSGHKLEAHNHQQRYYLITHRQSQAQVGETNLRTNGIEEIVVTGTWTSPTRFPSANNISTWNEPTFDEFGLTSAADLIAYIPSVSGTENQSNQFDNNFSAGTSNINLRGLGVSRTLVLLNGRRTVNSALPHDDGQSYVDLNSLPINAITRVELLKDGAAATYGSDAITGVVNFITQQPKDGLTLKSQYKAIDESAGDWNISAIWGQQSDSWQWLSSLEFTRRNELTAQDRDGITQSRVDIPSSGKIVFGESSIGNPGAFIPIDASTAAGGVSDAELSALAVDGNLVADPGCENFGRLLSNNRCSYDYLASDNLVEKETQLRWFNHLRWQYSESTEFYGELLAAHTDVPHWKTSPSYTPTQEVDIAYYIPSDHPALADFVTTNPTTLSGQSADFSGGGLYLGRARPAGENNGQEGTRQYQTLRLLAGVTIDHENHSNDLAVMYARNKAKAYTPDTHKARWQQALLGFGGASCSGNTPEENGCEYYNPFSSALAASVLYNPTLENSAELQQWMIGDATQTNTSELFTADWLFQINKASGVSLAVGAQLRHETLNIRYSDDSQLGRIDDVTQAPVNNLIFFAGGENDELQQTTAALFGEARFNVTHDLELQVAVRYENYLDNIGGSIDPKLATLWQLSDSLSLRGSVSTSFRAPSLNQTGQRSTTQEYIGYAGTFKSTYRIGNPELDAEKARNINLGILWQTHNHFRGSIDAWRIHLRDSIVQQSANDIVNNVISQSESNFSDQVIFDNGSRLSHIITHYINGPDIRAQGIDLHLEKTWFKPSHQLKLELNAAYLHRYQVEASALHESYDAVGRSNTGTSLQPLPQWKGNAALKLETQNHMASLRFNYVDSYVDEGLSILANTANQAELIDSTVEHWATWDLIYRYQWQNTSLTTSLAVTNLTDKAPPEVKDELRFESSLHNAFGRTATLSFNYHY
ncbi:MAG: TonB-dependent receptor domain-containing protein [Cellvibrionaceae bacterium]